MLQQGAHPNAQGEAGAERAPARRPARRPARVGSTPGADPRTAPGTAPGTAETLPRTVRDWAADYASRLALTDAIVITWAVFGAQFTRFGATTETQAATITSRYDITLNYTLISVTLVLGWLLALAVHRTRDRRVVGAGSDEYMRIARASLQLFGVVAIFAYLFKVDIARGYILMTFPLGLAVLLLTRWLWRQWLIAKRSQGAFSDRVLLLGSLDSVVAIARDLMRARGTGYRIVGAVAPGAHSTAHLPGTKIPLTGNLDVVPERMAECGATTLIVTSSDELPPQRIREISWSLEPGRQHLVMAPALTDIGGPRVHTRPVAGLPLVHVETPSYEGPQAFWKRAFDLAGSGVLILLLSPLLLVIAAIVRLSTPGPVLFRQDRVGYQGTPFPMLKFRSMVVDAEQRLAELVESDSARDAGNGVLFKMKDDPRVTRVGRVLRRYSLDELPQLFNVFAGQMSLVGPRPPLPREVEQYESHVHRKFLVKPGLTGLWQVSGRSSLSWEDSVRLDLYYVENWSVVGDLVLLWRTFRAVVGRDGAY